jgi:Tfp pilus assembly protein PilP
MKRSAGILWVVMAGVGASWAQNPDIIQNTRDTMKAVVRKKELDSNAALAASPTAAPAPVPASPNGKPTAAAASAKAPAAKAAPAKASAVAAKAEPTKAPAAKAPNAVGKATAAKAAPDPEVENKVSEPAPAKENAFVTAAGRRDPFVSPVVQHLSMTGCSTGKRCLAIDQINLKGIVKSEAGMIAVVVNALDKAYFLRENDPVFNGYVVKISGDSVTFKEQVQDRLGHMTTRDVTKKILQPAV